MNVCIFLCIIIVFVTNSNATNSCLQEWQSIGAYTAEGNGWSNDSVKILLHVHGKYNQYVGNYSAIIKLTEERNNSFVNGEPIFIDENNDNCIWKGKFNTWWIGVCDYVGENNGFAFMKDCNCPWPSFGKNENANDDIYYYEDDEETCNTCTWTKHSSDKNLICNSQDNKCEFGIGFISKNHDLSVNWPGDECYENTGVSNKNAGSHCSGCDQATHHSSASRLQQIIARFRVPNSRTRCQNQGGVLTLRKFPLPRIIKCTFPRGNSRRRTKIN